MLKNWIPVILKIILRKTYKQNNLSERAGPLVLFKYVVLYIFQNKENIFIIYSEGDNTDKRRMQGQMDCARDSNILLAMENKNCTKCHDRLQTY